MDAAEAAMIAGIFPSPARYSPLNNISFAMKKQSAVLEAMIRDSHFNKKRKEQIIRKFTHEYEVVLKENDKSPGKIGLYGANRQFRLNLAPNVNEYAIRFLRNAIEEETVNKGGLKIYTTIDPERQDRAMQVMRNYTEKLRTEFINNNKEYPGINRMARDLNGVLLSIDPYTGNILAEVGGFSVDDTGGQLDRVRQMRRQPGSVIKPVLYAAALDEGVIKPGTVFVDEKVIVDKYQPKNWYKGYLGEISLRDAIGRSVNTVAVKTIQALGPSTFIKHLAEILSLGYFEGKERFENNLTLGLGSGELTPLELSLIYGTLLNGGNRVYPKLVLKITDMDENVYWEDTYGVMDERVLSRVACMVTVDAMQAVLEEEGTAQWIGKKRQAKPEFLPFPVAGKSGTVQTDRILRKKFKKMKGVHDVWFTGLVPGEATIVWFGNDKGAPFEGSGSGTAGAVWANYAAGLKNIPEYFFEDMKDVQQRIEEEKEKERAEREKALIEQNPLQEKTESETEPAVNDIPAIDESKPETVKEEYVQPDEENKETDFLIDQE